MKYAVTVRGDRLWRSVSMTLSSPAPTFLPNGQSAARWRGRTEAKSFQFSTPAWRVYRGSEVEWGEVGWWVDGGGGVGGVGGAVVGVGRRRGGGGGVHLHSSFNWSTTSRLEPLLAFFFLYFVCLFVTTPLDMLGFTYTYSLWNYVNITIVFLCCVIQLK